MTVNQQSVEHFLRLARRGAMSHASSGEERARRLLDAILEHGSGLDASAIDGASDFLRMLSVDYAIAMRLASPKERIAS